MSSALKNKCSATLLNDRDELLERDIWKTEEIGVKPDTVHSTYYFNFSRLKPTWFKQAVKKLVRFQAATKSHASCHSYIVGLTHFGLFLTECYPSINPDRINRKIIVKYIEYLANTALGTVSRITALIHLRTFHTIIWQEKWLPWPSEPLIYASDIPKQREDMPRFIPELVIEQLQRHLPKLPEYLQHLITVMLETGRRISEICTLPLDCIEQDAQGDYFLKITEKKLKKSYLIPISTHCLKAIQMQQSVAKSYLGDKRFLFPSQRSDAKTPHVTARPINDALNKLARDYHIKDANDEIWHFHTHQFRHTVGTRMINAGVPQAIVQRYLGHESPEMTARYAYIQDATLKAAFNEYQGKLIDIHGKMQRYTAHYQEAKWLQHNIMAQALPNGLCALPAPQQRCPHANACLTCVHFRTHEKFLPQHAAQLETTNKMIAMAKENGWQRQVEMNLIVKQNLENIIGSLQKENSHADKS